MNKNIMWKAWKPHHNGLDRGGDKEVEAANIKFSAKKSHGEKGNKWDPTIRGSRSREMAFVLQGEVKYILKLMNI